MTKAETLSSVFDMAPKARMLELYDADPAAFFEAEAACFQRLEELMAAAARAAHVLGRGARLLAGARDVKAAARAIVFAAIRLRPARRRPVRGR